MRQFPLRHLLSCASFVVVSPAALAADDGPRCNPNGNQAEMNVCAANDYQAADAALNAKYRSLMSNLPDARKIALRDQQRAWLKRRDPACKAKAKGSEGGSIWPLVFYGCLKDATESRTRALDAFGAHP